MASAQLYRHFDKHSRLLYIGISLSTVARLSQHRDCSHWFDRIVHIVIEHYETREEASAAEARAIEVEKPFYNKVFNKKGLANSLDPVDQERLKHIDERYDFLVRRPDFRGDPEYYVKIKGQYVGKISGQYGSDEFFDSYMKIRQKYDKDYGKRVKEYWERKIPGAQFVSFDETGLRMSHAIKGAVVETI